MRVLALRILREIVSLVLCRWLGRVRGRKGRGMTRTTRRSPCTTPRTYHSGKTTHTDETHPLYTKKNEGYLFLIL